MKKLVLLDLDHTIIYGSYAESETANLLFQYNKYLKVYERPFAKELITLCNENADVIVYTTALRPYAVKICKKLSINPIALLSRKQCLMVNNKQKKMIRAAWTQQYEKIIIIDDSPNVWELNMHNIEILAPSEFRGSKNDFELMKILTQLNDFLIN